jgi:hypothetical protein
MGWASWRGAPLARKCLRRCRRAEADAILCAQTRRQIDKPLGSETMENLKSSMDSILDRVTRGSPRVPG